MNASFERTLGFTSRELCSRPFIEFVHVDDHDRTQQEIVRLASGEDTVRFDNRYQCKDGSWRWLAWTCPAPRENSGILYAVARDITLQKEAEEQLRIRDSIFDSMQNGLLITDPHQPDNPIVYCNQAFTELTGYAVEDVLGRNCRFLQREDTSQPQLDVLRGAIVAAQTCRVMLRNYRQDRSMFWNELIVSPVQNSEGQLTHFVGMQYDVSQIVHANSERWQEFSQLIASLAPRQRQVLDLLVNGQNVKSIAKQLGISPKTAEVHRARVLEKLSVDSTVELVRLVVANSPPDSTAV